MEERVIDKINVLNKGEIIEFMGSALYEYANNEEDNENFDGYLRGVVLGCLISLGLGDMKEVKDGNALQLAMQIIQEVVVEE